MIPCNHNYELGRELKDIDEAQRIHEEREAAVASRKAELLADRRECDPWTLDHIFEALSNMGLAGQLVVATYAATANDLPDNDIAQIMLARGVRKAIIEYWDGVAEHIARKELA